MSHVRLTFERPEEPSVGTAANRLLTGGNWPKVDEIEPADPLGAFDSEDIEGGANAAPADADEETFGGPGQKPAPWVPAPLPPEILRRPSRLLTPRNLAVGLVALAVATGAAVVTYSGDDAAAPGPAAATTEGRALISSNPAGALVFVDGAPRGATPIDLLLPVGVHSVQLQHGNAHRTVLMEIAASQVSSQYIELPAAQGLALADPAPPVTPPVARLETAPAARPASSRPEPSQQRAVPQRESSPRATPPVAQALASRSVLPRPPAVEPAGWVAVDLPFPVQVSERGRVLGTLGRSPLKLPAGMHTLELASVMYEFRTTLAVNIAVDKTAAMPVTLPQGSLSVNALPWAEVFVDGQSIGTTPLANIPVAVGSHEIVWRHPRFGERRQTVAVTARTPVRRGTDYTR